MCYISLTCLKERKGNKSKHNDMKLMNMVQLTQFKYIGYDCAKLLQSCPTLYDPMNCSPPGSSVTGIFQARILELVAISFSRGSSRPCRDPSWIS